MLISQLWTTTIIIDGKSIAEVSWACFTHLAAFAEVVLSTHSETQVTHNHKVKYYTRKVTHRVRPKYSEYHGAKAGNIWNECKTYEKSYTEWNKYIMCS